MWRLIEAMWLAAGAVSVAGTLWLMVASKLGIWPFRRRPVDRGEFWFNIPGGGIVQGRGTIEQGLKAMSVFCSTSDPEYSFWFEGADQ